MRPDEMFRNGMFKVLYSTKKDVLINEMDMFTIDLPFTKIKEEKLYETTYKVIIKNLNIGTKYYMKVIFEQYSHGSFIESLPSESTDGITIDCPDGAYCGIVGGNGVSINDVKNLNGYYKINQTFTECHVKKNCPGVILNTNGRITLSNQTIDGCHKGDHLNLYLIFTYLLVSDIF